ncbi:hypothetical protein EDD21DRAFT_280162, partial [Dissophora ornata]
WHDENSPGYLSYLGYLLPICRKQIDEFFEICYAKIDRCLHIHNQRSLSVLGRSTIVNSGLWHVIWAAQPSKSFLQKVQTRVRQF